MCQERDVPEKCVPLKVIWFATLLLAALGMTMGAAHMLELPAKLNYDAQTYAVVNSTLYRQFAYVGGPVQIFAIVGAAWLAYRLRPTSSFGLSLGALICLMASFGMWWALVQPVNAEWARLIREDPDAVVHAYAQMRDRWEYGHAAAFVVWLAGVGLLLSATLRQVAVAPALPATRG